MIAGCCLRSVGCEGWTGRDGRLKLRGATCCVSFLPVDPGAYRCFIGWLDRVSEEGVKTGCTSSLALRKHIQSAAVTFSKRTVSF